MLESPDCPKCGCNGATKHGKGVRWGKPWQRYTCGHCGHGWSGSPPTAPESEDGLPVVAFYTMLCPRCYSSKTHVTNTLKPEKRRYHVCDSCKKTFVSYEENPPKRTK